MQDKETAITEKLVAWICIGFGLLSLVVERSAGSTMGDRYATAWVLVIFGLTILLTSRFRRRS